MNVSRHYSNFKVAQASRHLFVGGDAATKIRHSRAAALLGFNYLKNEGLIETKVGINITTGAQGTEVAISNKAVKEAVLKTLKN